jgi:hypothetical protein
MTDEDRILLGALARLNDACGKFGMGVLEDSLSHEDQIGMALMFLDMADRVLKRVVDNPAIVEGDTT